MQMSKKRNRVHFELHADGVKSLTDQDIKTILRGADDLIMSGGRSMLANILAGSKDKKLLEKELDYSPVYGEYKGTSQKEILAKIDWMILHNYLQIEYNGRLPLLVYTKKGWEIEKETYSDELLEQLVAAAENRSYEFVETLKDRDRGMIFLLLDKIAETENKNLLTILKAWEGIEYKKVKMKIQEIINTLEKVEDKPSKERNHEVLSFTANKKWLAIPAETRKKLEQNVWCGNCGDVVPITKYVVKDSGNGIVLEGKCKNCGHKVARFIEG
jgi:superfamily II DNA helicase RecQ